MSNRQQERSYSLHGTTLQVFCSIAMSACLDARFRLLPADERSPETIFFDFRPAADPHEHSVKKPQGEGRPFYELPEGEACYFADTDEVYLGFRDGVRALYEPRMNRVSVSSVESEPKNLFVASHLVMTILLVEAFKRRDWYGLHAAGFSENGRAILIPGTSGCGKSTLSLALLRAKFDYLADDMVFLGRRPNGLVVRGFAEDVDVSEQTIHFFPELDFLLQSPKLDGFPKRQVRPEQVYETTVVTESRPQAMVFPRISDKPGSVITQMVGDEALLEVVPNVLLTQARACQAHLGVLAELVKQTPCYRLETGRDFDQIPVLFRELLSSDRDKVCA